MSFLFPEEVAEIARHRLKSTTLETRNPPGFAILKPSDLSDGAAIPFPNDLLVSLCNSLNCLQSDLCGRNKVSDSNALLERVGIFEADAKV